jgi:hypothetical protein
MQKKAMWLGVRINYFRAMEIPDEASYSQTKNWVGEAQVSLKELCRVNVCLYRQHAAGGKQPAPTAANGSRYWNAGGSITKYNLSVDQPASSSPENQQAGNKYPAGKQYRTDKNSEKAVAVGTWKRVRDR